ncbi:hypothetical protein HUG15_20160 [Salicibibacter cibarius]|uniref:Uncharacterized protein n=1 Tax=Salicibibacter cibarius TaxID=2743000 RepID=A0A7T6Z632_9BACI|nr:hypothetical protein [Salicibibacter cibarius]QQK77668.1 hypothetical protein HUG15_20160 [Salicibibacter cibarius]
MSDETKEILNAVLHRLDALDANVEGVKTDVANLHAEMGSVKTDIANLNTEVAGVKTDVDSVKTEVASVKTEVASVKTELSEFRTETNQRFDHMDRQLRLFDSDTDMLNKKVAEHDRDIHRLKQAQGI